MTTRIGTSQESSPERKLAPDTTITIPLGWRIGLSVLLLLHLLAVFLPPFQFACRVGNGSSSPFADGLANSIRPYIGLMYLDHGYFFFAPNPGPSHLVKYKVEFADDREPIEGRFPNLQEQQPRLKYHRHFMIAEALYNQYESPIAPPEPSPPALNSEQSERDRRLHADRVEAHKVRLREWQFRRRQYEEMRKSLEEHLMHVHGGSKVTLTRVEHRLLSPFEANELRMRPNDPATYIDLRESPAANLSGANP